MKLKSIGDPGAVGGRLRGSIPLVFCAATTFLSGLLVALAWLTGEHRIVMLIPIIPAVFAVALSAVRKETADLKDLLKSLFNVRVRVSWLATSVLVLPILAGIALGAYALTSDASLTIGDPQLAIVLAALPLALSNELGWRGFLSNHLRVRHGLFVKSILVGVLWTISISPMYLFDIQSFIDVDLWQVALALIPMSVLMFWLKANTNSLLMPALFGASGIMTVAFLPILPGDSGQGVTLWLIIGMLWLVAALVVGYFGTDKLDRTIEELPPDELPVDWDKFMPRESKREKSSQFRSAMGRRRSNKKKFTPVGSRVRR